jgi:DNA-binding CsgD family transcriptional regulator
MLRGRTAECERIHDLVQNALEGRGGSLVFRGEAGIGKSALLTYAADAGKDLRVARISGVESEVELPYAALHQLCGKMLHLAGRLPALQADALGVALGQRAGEVPDRLRVGLAVLGLLSEAARRQPMLCLVDDAQWIDQSSLFAIAFVARRVDADSLALVFATRGPAPALAGIDEVLLGGLREIDALALLASVIPGQLDEGVRDRILAETRGNPLALLELSRGLKREELAGGFGLPKPAVLSSRLEEEFLRRVRGLPEPTQRLLLLAAAEPLGDPGLLWRAGRHLGISSEDAAAAESEGLFQVQARATFRHPLVRSAIYRAAPQDERHRIHQALANATDAEVESDRHAWHLAHATSGPDDAVAGELERSASRAQARGGPAAAAAFLERAAALTSGPDRRATLILASAELQYDAGAYRAAGDLLEKISDVPLADFYQVRVERLRGRLMLGMEGAHNASELLMKAARQLEPYDIEVACDTYLDAFVAGTMVGASNAGHAWQELARRVRSLPGLAESGRATDVLVAGLAANVTDGYAASLPPLRRALEMMLTDPRSVEERSARDRTGLLWFGCLIAASLWDADLLFRLASRMLSSARTITSVTLRGGILSDAASVAVLKGDFPLARALSDETLVMRATAGFDDHSLLQGPLALAAWQGRGQSFEALAASPASSSEPNRFMISRTVCGTRSVLRNGHGRYEEALADAQRASEHAEDRGWALWSLPELVEAATRSGSPDVAAAAVQTLCETTGPAATDWGLGITAFCRALVSEGDTAESLHREAVERLQRAGVVAYLARAHLVFGEWLRRENRRIDARDQLRTARELFASMGAAAFTARAERELLVTGVNIRKWTGGKRDELTAQERQVADLARDGLSNPQIGSQLFISPRTVEYHLHKVFTKLGISSRTQLNRALETRPPAT